jgi:hypothetical protein
MTGTCSLGLWIVRRGVAPWRKRESEYRGLDRRPDLPGPDEDTDLRDQGRARLIDLRNEFWDREDSRELHRDPVAALRLSGALNAEGFSVEVVLADLIPASNLNRLPADLRSAYEERLSEWLIESPPVTDTARSLGIDVTYPFPTFHSAIRQPTLSEIAPELIDELNDSGLFADLDVAQQAADRGNRRDTSWRPLCAVEISLVEAGTGD